MDYDPIPALTDLAQRHRLARVAYKKPGLPSFTVRVVEPYKLFMSRNALLVRTYQVRPEPTGWRSLRLDRIRSVEDADETFTPRAEIDLGTEDVPVMEFQRERWESMNRYYQSLMQIIEHPRLDEEDQRLARRAARDIADNEQRLAHVMLMRDLLDEILLDGEVTEEDAIYLNRVSNFLSTIGFSPGVTVAV